MKEHPIQISTAVMLEASHGNSDDLADALNLIDALKKAESNGQWLGLIMGYRFKVRRKMIEARDSKYEEPTL